MENRSFYNEILTEHNVRPEFKHDLPDADIVLEGVNPSCGDDIFLKLKTDGRHDYRWCICRGRMRDFPGFRRYHAWHDCRKEKRRGPADGENLYENDQRRCQRGGD